jgi:signal transduction histidine kinase/DNA-binding response OmpR family regulator
MNNAPIKVLLVDDDEDDFVITRSLISEIGDQRYKLDWVNNYVEALAAIHRCEHDLCLLDYRLGELTGLDLLRESKDFSLRPPMILLTGQGDHEIDLEAMKAGAVDYLIKGQLTAHQLDRAMRYALERKRAEERLRRERDLISRVMETSPVGIVVADQSGKITFANHCAEKVLGLSPDAIAHCACSVLDWRVADAEGVPQEGPRLPLQQLLETSRPVVDVCHAVELPGNRRLVLSTNATPLFDAAGKNDGMVVTVEDITERLALEAQLRQSQKMELVGQLAAGVAHDINNILTVIQGHTGLLLHTATAESHSMKSLKQIAAASDRAAGFVRHLLMFSRKQVVQTRILDLNAVLHNLQAMLTPMLGEQIALELHCQPGLPLVAADASMTEQIVMNLAVNARDAMLQGGTLYIETSAVEIPVALARQNPDAHAGSFICLCVRDTGCGMERKVLQRIFEPFFTTKEVGKGTGLGLSTVYGIVRQHQGWIEVESEIGLGTTFKVFLPVADPKAGATPVNNVVKSETVNGGKETILVVEDETSLLKVLCSVLQRYQYNVLSAVTAAEAISVWDEQNGKIDLLLTDMVMPGPMSGIDLVNELKKRKPGLKVIVTSGYCDELTGRDLAHADARFLPKPYQPQLVAQLVRKMLDAAGGWPSARSAVIPATKPALRCPTHVIAHPSAVHGIPKSRIVSASVA